MYIGLYMYTVQCEYVHSYRQATVHVLFTKKQYVIKQGLL